MLVKDVTRPVTKLSPPEMVATPTNTLIPLIITGKITVAIDISGSIISIMGPAKSIIN